MISMQAGDQTKLVTATQTFTLDVSDKHVRANCAVYDALNNIYAMGADHVGIELALLVPTTENEAVLRETVRAIDAVCEEAGIVVLGGHTQVSRAVKNIVVTVTAIGEAYEQALTPSSAAAPGMDVIVTGYVGLEGTAILANEKRAELETRFSKAFIDKSAAYIDHISTAMEAASAIGAGVAAIHDASQGGIFGALWDMAEASGIGLDIDLKKLPIGQDTIEISEFFDINPYKLLSGGSLIIIAADGTRVVRELEKTGQNAVIVGATTDSNDRVLISGEERRFWRLPRLTRYTRFSTNIFESEIIYHERKDINIYRENSRINLKELAIMLGVDEASVANEIAAMEQENVICGYHTLIDWDKAGLEKVTAMIEVRVTPQRGMGFDKIAERIYNYPEVKSVYLISGGFDLMVTLEGKTLREVSQFVTDKLSTLDQCFRQRQTLF